MTHPSFRFGPALLFCPADRPDRFEKAVERADAVILDLEDAVAADAKHDARLALVESTLDPERVIVRLNAASSADFAEDLHSWRGGALGPAHTLRQSAFLRGSNRSRRVRGLLYAGGSSVPGIGLPMCLIGAENVLKRVRGDRSSGPLPEPPAGGSAAAPRPVPPTAIAAHALDRNRG